MVVPGMVVPETAETAMVDVVEVDFLVDLEAP